MTPIRYKVKVISCCDNELWYKDKIGCEYTTLISAVYNPFVYWVLDEERFVCFIHKDDAMEVFYD